MTPTTTAAAAGLDRLPAGLTDADATRIKTALAAARAESTRQVYALAWGHWERWCTERGLAALPCDPLTLAAYLTERADAGRAMGTLDMACTVIRHVHRAAMGGAAVADAFEDPVGSEIVGQVRRGLRRTYGTAPRRLARPLTVAELRQMIDAIDRTTVIGVRDAAMILLGDASALRRAELVALTLADIEHQPTGLLLTIRASKMDQEGHGALVAVARGQHPATDPVAALNTWRHLRDETPGALFTRLWGSTPMTRTRM